MVAWRIPNINKPDTVKSSSRSAGAFARSSMSALAQAIEALT
jgi:hypothetical protein